jgi:hypothetical protein
MCQYVRGLLYTAPDGISIMHQNIQGESEYWRLCDQFDVGEVRVVENMTDSRGSWPRQVPVMSIRSIVLVLDSHSARTISFMFWKEIRQYNPRRWAISDVQETCVRIDQASD